MANPSQNTPKALTIIVEWLLKFMIPPMVGALVLAILSEIHFFYENFDFVTILTDTPFKVFIYHVARNFLTFFYWYYLLVYIPFFVYLVCLQKFNKLSLVVVLVSGFIYALSPLLFGTVNLVNDLILNLDNLLIMLAIILSGLLCSLTYYYLHKKLTV